MNAGETETTVQTLIKLPGGAQPVAVDYDMAKLPEGWKVYDVRVAGASLIINYRNLFAQEIQNGGIDGLIKSLVDKNSGQCPGAGQAVNNDRSARQIAISSRARSRLTT